MRNHTKVQHFGWLLGLLVLLGAPIGAWGADGAPAEARQVEFFEAIEAGEIEVEFIPRNAERANVLIENQGEQPLVIQLPDAFAGVPVLAQFGGVGDFGGQQGGVGGTSGMQGIGGGMGGVGGMFNVEPGRVGRLQVPTVCLEHGKEDPNPRVPYEIRPIETFTDNQGVIEICRMLGDGEVPQGVAQAAAWHLTDNLSWKELATMNRVQLRSGHFERFFSPQEVQLAVRVVGEANRRVEQSEVQASDSLGQR